MRRLIILATLAIVLGAVLAACGDSSTDTTGTATAGPATSAPAAGSAADGAAIWNAQCSGCHQGSADVSGTEAAEVQSVVENGAGGMPAFADELSAAEIQAVSEYVAGGMK
jgi:mono/diheme cytochrome c family protein